MMKDIKMSVCPAQESHSSRTLFLYPPPSCSKQRPPPQTKMAGYFHAEHQTKAGRRSRCRYISQRLHEIMYSNEVLEKGLSQLEALCLELQMGRVPDKYEARQTVSILSGQNHYLAHAINTALQDVESILRQHVEGGTPLTQDTISEFSDVLKESIRVLHDYQFIQESYSLQDTKARKDSPTTSTIFSKGKQCKKGNNCRRSKKTILQRILQLIFLCGGLGIN